MNVSVAEIFDILPPENLQNVKSLCVLLAGQPSASWNNITTPFFFIPRTLFQRCTVNTTYNLMAAPRSSSKKCSPAMVLMLWFALLCHGRV